MKTKKIDEGAINKHRKTHIKAVYKKLISSDAHITILIDEFGKVKMYTDMADSKEIAYTLVYVANDLQNRVNDLDKMIIDEQKEAIKEKYGEEEEEEK